MDYPVLWARHQVAPGQLFVPPGVIFHFTRTPEEGQGKHMEVEVRAAGEFYKLKASDDFLADHKIFNPMKHLCDPRLST